VIDKVDIRVDLAAIFVVRASFSQSRMGLQGRTVRATSGETRFVLIVPYRDRVVAIVLRHGDVVAIVIAFTRSSLPPPLIVQPAAAQQGGNPPPPTGTPTRTPTRTGTPTHTPTAVPIEDLYHFHTDHLGSTQLITDISGNPYQYVRYTPYGTVRGRYSSLGTPVSFDDRLRYEFTGYETEPESGLQYAGARFYDPALGMFLTHDPARQFANPYAYGPWDPVNGSDPSGAFWLEAFAIGFAIGFAATTIQALANGASVGEALEAGAVSGIVGGVTGVGLGVVGIAAQAIHPILDLAYNAALAGSGAYSTVQGFESGQGVLGAVGAVGLAFGLYRLGGAAARTTNWVGAKLNVAQGAHNQSSIFHSTERLSVRENPELNAQVRTALENEDVLSMVREAAEQSFGGDQRSIREYGFDAQRTQSGMQTVIAAGEQTRIDPNIIPVPEGGVSVLSGHTHPNVGASMGGRVFSEVPNTSDLLPPVKPLRIVVGRQYLYVLDTVNRSASVVGNTGTLLGF
jgi:RHS repeat-associated protein